MSEERNTDERVFNGHGYQIFLLVLGLIANLLIGAVTFYIARLSTDIDKIADIARTGSANVSLLGRDVENLAKWSAERINDLEQRVRYQERQIRRRNND